MQAHFYDRVEAGRLLANELRKYAVRSNVQVLALPRGGVPIGFEVAAELKAPLDVFLVRKLGVPGHEELAMGAIASGGVRVLNQDIIRRIGISTEEIERVSAREKMELRRRELAYRGDAPPTNVSSKIVILVDDGIATGSTMRAAVTALKKQSPERIVVGAPTAPRSCRKDLGPDFDELVTVAEPDPFYSVGQAYQIFDQTTDEEVRALLAEADRLCR